MLSALFCVLLLVSVAPKGIFYEPDMINLELPLLQFDRKPELRFIRIESHQIKEEPCLMRSLSKSEFVIHTTNNCQQKDRTARNFQIFSFSKEAEMTQMLKLHNLLTRQNSLSDSYTVRPASSGSTERALGSIPSASIRNWNNLKTEMSRTSRGMPEVLQGESCPYADCAFFKNKGTGRYKINGDPRALAVPIYTVLQIPEPCDDYREERHYPSCARIGSQPLVIFHIFLLTLGATLLWLAQSAFINGHSFRAAFFDLVAVPLIFYACVVLLG
jgi:hypothetical protein